MSDSSDAEYDSLEASRARLEAELAKPNPMLTPENRRMYQDFLDEMKGLHPAAPIDKLSKKQKSRALATLSGKTTSQIAKDEGVSKQAVADSLKAEIVRSSLRELIIVSTVTETRGGKPIGNGIPLIQFALDRLSELCVSTKPCIVGNRYEMVPDNATRLAATMKIIELYQAAAPQQAARMQTTTNPAPQAVVEEVAVEESSTSTKRVSRRRSAHASSVA